MRHVLILPLATGAARLPGFHTCVGGGGDRQEAPWYKDKGITYLTNTKATSVKIADKSVTLEDGTVITWDKLVLATGAEVSQKWTDVINYAVLI